MKRTLHFHIYLLFVIYGLILAGCSDEITEYAELEELNIRLDRQLYTCAIGDMLYIEPDITGEIPDDDLVFDWEVGHDEGYGDHAQFTTIASMRNLNIECKLGPLFPVPATYTLRIHARQLSKEREFYSPHFKLKITGQTGLMVLYGKNSQSDIALIRNFTGSNDLIVNEHYYSSANGNRMISGSGRFLTQLQGGNPSFANYHSVVAVTDETSIGANYMTMCEIAGGWDNLLFKGKFNRGLPENIVYSSSDPMYQYQEVYIIDGGEIYGRQCSEFVLRPAIGTSSNAYIDFYDLSPYAYTSNGSPYSVWLFDKKSRGFVGVTNIISVFMNGAADPGSVVKVFTPGGKFNPSRMRADLIYMGCGGENGHLLAVMKRDNGQMFVAELNTIPDDPSGTAQAIYEWDNSASDEILGYDFSSHAPSRQCCYFYTTTDIFRFTVDGKDSTIAAIPIDVNGAPVAGGNEEITAMKTLSYDGDNLMLVATWNGVEAKITCYRYELNSGDILSPISSWTLPGKVFDFHLKHV